MAREREAENWRTFVTWSLRCLAVATSGSYLAEALERWSELDRTRGHATQPVTASLTPSNRRTVEANVRLVKRWSLLPLLASLAIGPMAQTSCAPSSSLKVAAGSHSCTEVRGLPYIALSFDGGRTLVQSREPRVVGTEVTGLLALDTPDTLLAVVNDELFASEDAGCDWKSVGRTHAAFFAKGDHGVAYGWGWQGGLDALSVRGVEPRTEPPSALAGPLRHLTALVVDPANPLHLRSVTYGGEVFDSLDQGASWALEARHQSSGFTYIAPNDLDRLFALGSHAVSRDGGHTWVTSRGYTGSRPDVAVLVGGDVVWLVDAAGVFRSVDGGASFSLAGPGPERRDHGVGNTLTDGTGELVLDGSSRDSLLLLGTGNDLRRLAVGATAWTNQQLRLSNDPRGVVTKATLLPGHPSAVCFAVTTPREVPEGWVF